MLYMFEVKHMRVLAQKTLTIIRSLSLTRGFLMSSIVSLLLSGHISRFIITELLGRKKTRKGFCFYIPAFYLLIEKIEVRQHSHLNFKI